MNKTKAIELLGGTVKMVAKRCHISSSAVSQWPEVLTKANKDRVQAALYRMRYYRKEGDQKVTDQ